MDGFKKCDCIPCSFENPKPTATAVIMRDGKILVLKRNEEPFLGEWDFVGGYIHKDETPEQALVREIKEELGASARIVSYFGAFPGTASYKEYGFPVLSFVYGVELIGDINLDTKENSEYAWLPLSSLMTVAFDSNQDILRALKARYGV